MSTIKARRAAFTELFTRSYNELATEINKTTRTLSEIQRLRKQLEDRFTSLEKIDEDFEVCMQEKETTEAEYFDEYNKTFEYRDKFGEINLIVNNLENWEAEKNRFENESNTISHQSNMSCNIGSKYKLPKLELRKFNGDLKEWHGWWSQFNGIHEDTNLSMEHKFQYLIQATVKDSPAYELVTSFPPTAMNYPKVIQCLKSRFGSEDVLVEVYVRELLILVLNNTTDGQKNTIASLYDKLETQLHGLETLGVTSDKYAAMLYPLIESAILEEILKTWQRMRNQKIIDQAETSKAENQLNLLMKFLRTEVDSEMHLKLARNGISGNDNKSKFSIES